MAYLFGPDYLLDLLLGNPTSPVQLSSRPSVQLSSQDVAPTSPATTVPESIASTWLDSPPSSSRSRSPSGPAIAWQDDEDSEGAGFYKLNVIEPSAVDTPPRRAIVVRRQESPSEPAADPASFRGPIVHQPTGPSQSAAAAAADRACRQLFGSSSSVFHHGAMMSYMLRGSVADLDVVGSMARSLPEGVDDVGYNILKQVARMPGIRLMGAPSSAVQQAAQLVRSRLQMNSDLHFYVGITERPEHRFKDHQGSGYSEMWLHIFPNSQYSGSAEHGLIKELKPLPQCQNVGAGNERASGGRPHFLYIAWKPATNNARR